MSLEKNSVKRAFLLACGGMAASMSAVCAIFYAITGELWALAAGIPLTACALIWMFILMLFFRKRLSVFTGELCRTMDLMINGNEAPVRAADSETLFARISCRLLRLYGIMRENRRNQALVPGWKQGRSGWKRKTAC